MKILGSFTVLWCIMLMLLVSGCESGGGQSAYQQVPTQRIIVQQESTADMLRAQTEAWDSMHRQQMETNESIMDTLDSMTETGYRVTGSISRQAQRERDRRCREQQKSRSFGW